VFLTVYYPRRSQKSMGAMGKKISSFLLTQYTGSYFDIYQNNIIKMWDKYRFLEFAWIILFILIGQILLISSSDLVSMFLSIKFNSSVIYIFSILHRNSELSTIAGLHGWIDPFLLLAAMVPIKNYSNTEADKDKILKENKNKSGIYMWRNLINNKRYIGSAINLSDRVKFYFTKSYMKAALKNSRSHIYSALLKNGYSNFSLTILEYCDKEKCIEREDYYLSCLPHEYNILEKAGSWLGHKHSDDTKTKISDALKGEKNPMFGKTLSNETKQILSEANKGKKNPMYNKPKPEGAGKPSQAIEVTDMASPKNYTTTSYNSIREAARALNIHKSVIDNYFKNNKQKPYKGRYTFKRTPKN